jgi:hypothetical protein
MSNGNRIIAKYIILLDAILLIPRLSYNDLGLSMFGMWKCDFQLLNISKCAVI